MTNPNDFDAIVILVPRRVVEDLDLDFMLISLQDLTKDIETIRKSKNKVTIGFDGFDDDPREAFEIHEIRDYLKALTIKFPYWFYFCSKCDHTLWVLLLSQCRYKKYGPGGAKVEIEDLKEMMKFLFINLNDFYEKYNLSEFELESLSKEIGEYFANQKIPSL